MKIFRSYKIISLLSTLIFLGGVKIVNAGVVSNAVAGGLKSIQVEIANAILGLVSQILRLSGILFNYVLTYTINFSTLIGEVGVVDIGWKIFRDLSNMLFIFILLTISIAIILGKSSYGSKALLVKVILVALLINFSLFTNKVIIDAANVFTVGFYNATIQNTDKGGMDSWDKGISSMFARSLNLHTIYKQGSMSDGSKDSTGVTLEPTNIWTICIMGSVFLLVTAFIFFAASILLMKRIVVLMFLMMVSPLAFLGMILPATSGYSSQWWKTLFKEAFYAPVFMMFIYVVASGINSEAFRTTIGKDAGKTSDFANAFTGGAGDGMSFVIFNFILIIGLMVASLISAEKIGANGAGGMMKMGKGLQNWGENKVRAGAGAATFGVGGRLARGSFGFAAQKAADSDSMKNWAAKGGFGSKLALKTLRYAGDATYDVRNTGAGKALKLGDGIKGGYKTKREDAKKKEITYAKSIKGDMKKRDASGNLMTDPTTGAPIMISRTENYVDKNKDKKNIWTSVISGSGTGKGRQQALQTIYAETTAKAKVKDAQNALKNDTTIIKLRRDFQIQKDIFEQIKNGGRLPTDSEIDTYYKAEDKLKIKEDELKEEIEKAKEKLAKAKEDAKA